MWGKVARVDDLLGGKAEGNHAIQGTGALLLQEVYPGKAWQVASGNFGQREENAARAARKQVRQHAPLDGASRFQGSGGPVTAVL